MFNQPCYYNGYLLCCVIHHRSTGWCYDALLYCEEEIQVPQDLLHGKIPQAEEATACTSV